VDTFTAALEQALGLVHAAAALERLDTIGTAESVEAHNLAEF
jgi:hypothetical protein